MNYYSFKFSENTNGYYFYFISPFDGSDIDLVSESIEHYISNVPTEMNKYLVTVNFDDVKIERVVSTSVMDIINNHFSQDDKNMLVSDSWKSLIPPSKAKRTPKPKAEKEKKEPKARGKKATQKVEISTENTTLNMNQ